MSHYSFLRRVLLLDAALSTVTGLCMIAGAGLVENLLGVPAELMRSAGLCLVPFVILVAFVATRKELSRRAVWAVIVLNALWVFDSFAILFTNWMSPTVFGYAFVIAQALVVGVLAELEYIGLRQAAA